MVINEDKEIISGTRKWLNTRFYKEIGNLQTDLNASERAMLVSQLATSLKLYESMILGMKDVRETLYAKYTEAVENKRATSQFSRNFNMSLQGHNKLLGEQIDKAFRVSYEHEVAGRSTEAALTLKFAEFGHKILFDKDIISVVKSNNNAANRELVRIDQYRERLFLSSLKLTVRIAKQHTSRLKGNTIEWSDLVQEAAIAAVHAVESYSPVADGNTFTSYVYTYVNGIISKKLSEITRTVAVPRTTLDRYGCLQQAMDDLGIIESDVLGGLWTDGKLSEGKISEDILNKITVRANSLKSPSKKKYTSNEVENLLTLSRGEISLSQEVGHSGAHTTLGDTLPNSEYSLEEKMDGMLLNRRLMAIIRKFTNEEEYAIMEIRYGFGVVRGFHTVSDLYIKNTGRPMNKGKVSQIETAVFNRIRDAVKLDEELARSFKELIVSLAYVGV